MTRLGHQLEVAAYPWLALAENLGEFADIELTMRKDKQQPKPCRLGNCAHSGKKLVH
jgi:hypothetical protein